jgi:hypothetical protein
MQAKSLLPSLQSFIGKSYLILKTCFLLSHFDTLNFRKFLKVVWVVLKHLCKSYERNRKQKIEKGCRTKKKGRESHQPNWAVPGTQNQPSRPQPAAQKRNRTGTPSMVPPLSYTWTPPVRSSSTLVRPAPETAAINAPWLRPLPGTKSRHETSL